MTDNTAWNFNLQLWDFFFSSIQWKREKRLKASDLNIVALCTGIESSLFEGSDPDRTCNYSVNVFVSMLLRENWDVRDCKGCHFSSEFTRYSGFALFALWALWSSRINGTWGTARLTHKSVRVWMFCGVCFYVQRGQFRPWAMTD